MSGKRKKKSKRRRSARLLDRRLLLRRVGLAAGSGLVGLGVGELLIRLTWSPSPQLRLQQIDERLAGDPRHQLLDVFQSDPELFWRLAPNLTLPESAWPLFGLISNSQGLREEHHITTAKSNSEFRVLCVGDSCTFGFLLPHTESYVHFLEQALQKRFPDRPIQCINAGVPAWSLFQGWRFLETEGLAFDPDVVVLNFGWNDSDVWDGLSDFEHYERIRVSTPIRGLRWSRLCQLLWTWRNRKPPPWSTARPRLIPNELRQLLTLIRQSVAQRGAKLVLLIPGGLAMLHPAVVPKSDTPLHFEQYRIGKEGGDPNRPVPLKSALPLHYEQYQFAEEAERDGDVAYVDGIRIIWSMSREHPFNQLFLDEVHPTALVNQRLANAIAKKVEGWL